MNIDSYIDILLRDLKKKNQVLDTIIFANQEQKELLEDPNLDPDDFDAIVEKKAKLIDELDKLDEGFEQVYQRIKEELQENKAKYAMQIKELQGYIRQLTDKSATIQAQEQRNKEAMQKKFSEVKKQVREVRASQKVVDQYYRNMMKTGYVDPQFLDNKK